MMKTLSVAMALTTLVSLNAFAENNVPQSNQNHYVANELLKDLTDCYVKFDFLGKDTTSIENVLSLYDQEQVRVSINKYNSRFYQTMALGVQSLDRTQIARGCTRINQRAVSINNYVNEKTNLAAE